MSENQRNVTLPVIPRQIAETIERLREINGYNNAGILRLATRTGGALHNDTVMLNTIPFDILLASALVNGYTVEKSAEELEREAHDEIRDSFAYRTSGLADDEDDAYVDGMMFTLNTLGIKIEGVNA